MLEISIGAEIFYAIFLILVLSFFVLIKIAFYIKNLKIKGSGEKIIEKHFINNGVGLGNNSSTVVQEESEEEKQRRIKEQIDMESKWEKDEVEGNMSGLGEENKSDASSSMDAVEMLRKMNREQKGDNKKSG